MSTSILKKSELHIHLLQSLYPEDLFQMAKEHYREINWNRFGFLDRYQEIYGKRLDPVAIFQHAIETGSLAELEETCVYSYDERGDFEKFNIKSFFPICITGYYYDKNEPTSVLEIIVDRHKREGISYIEYRNAFGYSEEVKEEWKAWHRNFARFLKESSTDTFKAKYIIRISEGTYDAVKEVIRENPDIRDTIVGIDFTGRELPPNTYKEFFRRFHTDNKENPDEAIDMVVHIGEDYFDKSIESAIRWCHEMAEFGVKRLGHCIALGLDPVAAIKRRHHAHVEEDISERLDQIDYDLKYQEELDKRGVAIDKEKLLEEKKALMGKGLDEKVYREYDEKRLEDIRRRQDFVLEKFKEYGTVIETCPTSNLRIGAIPVIKDHPFKKFYEAGVNLVICSDDPGVFNSSLSDEVDFIANGLNIDGDTLAENLGDPYRFRLGRKHQ